MLFTVPAGIGNPGMVSLRDLSVSHQYRLVVYLESIFLDSEEKGEIPPGRAKDLAWGFNGLVSSAGIRWLYEKSDKPGAPMVTSILSVFFDGPYGPQADQST